MLRVAITGRPNVGKSTLFNRLIGRRRAITARTPGVTRDPVTATVEFSGLRVTFSDTGGYTAGEAPIDRRVSERALEVVAKADVVLFMFEGRQVTGEDELFLEHMNRFREKVLLVVNKIDTPEHESALYEFYRFGFEPVIGISAEHDRGIDELREELERRLHAVAGQGSRRAEAAEAGLVAGSRGDSRRARDRGYGKTLASAHDEINDEEREHDTTITLAILGQPNTGKSTLANALLGRQSSLIDPDPGTTRDVVEGEFTFGQQRFRLLDTAGMRRRSRVDEPVEYYSVNRAVATLSEADVVLLVIDAQKGVSEQDKKIAGLVVKRGCGVVLVLNKWDLMSGASNEFEAICDRVRFVFPVLQFAPIVAISAQENSGIKRMLRTAVQVYQELGERVDTGKLNRSLQEWVNENPPPMVKRRRPKLLYATQTGRRPPVFVIFAGRKSDVPESYVTFIKNRIREEDGYRLTPIRVEIRERSRS